MGYEVCNVLYFNFKFVIHYIDMKIIVSFFENNVVWNNNISRG